VDYLDNTNAHCPTAYTSTGTIRVFLCGRLSISYGRCGLSEVNDTAYSSSLVVINHACKAVQTGECSLALAGGANVIAGIDNYLTVIKRGKIPPQANHQQLNPKIPNLETGGLGITRSLRLKYSIPCCAYQQLWCSWF